MSEIIIDGCNVAECEFFIQDYQRANNIENRYEHVKNVCDLNGDNYFFCRMNQNCHFKQLQRAKAELEQYKASKQASYEAMQKEWNKAVNELRDVKGENEKLKKQFDKIEFLLPILKFPDENVRNNCVTKILKLIKDAENE